jgi:hypothetical protein
LTIEYRKEMINKLLSSALLILGIIALVIFTRDNPVYSEGEPTVLVKSWLAKVSSSADNITAAEGLRFEETWEEDYMGSGKWVVSRTRTYEPQFDSLEDLEKWFDRWREMGVVKLREYSADLPPEDLSTFQEGLWTTDQSDDLYQSDLDSWYLYEKSGLISDTDAGDKSAKD